MSTAKNEETIFSRDGRWNRGKLATIGARDIPQKYALGLASDVVLIVS